MDALSELLRVVRLRGAMYFNAEFSAPWAVRSPAASVAASLLAPGAQKVIIFHLVTAGRGYTKLAGQPAIPLAAGSVIVVPHGDSHVLGNGATATVVDAAETLPDALVNRLQVSRLGGGGEVTSFVCGYLDIDPWLANVLVAGLPPLLVVNVRDGDGGAWLESSIQHAVAQAAATAPGSEAIVAKLSEVLFAETLRRYMAALPPQQTGWLAGARDPAVGRALAAMHARPQHDWSLASLAAEAGLSRSALTERFKHYLGVPPMAYIAQWRLHLGADALRTTSRGVAEIAGDVGYESEAAFNRAFKRAFGVPPARFRRSKSQQAAAERSSTLN
jgi:AraC-like DNA-binding protein